MIASGTTTSRTCLAAGPDFLVVALFLFAGAAQRGERAGAAVVLAGKRARDGELAGVAAVLAAAGRASRLRALGRGGMAGTAEAALFLIFDDRRCGRFFGGRRGRSSERLFLGAAGGLGGFLFGLAILFGAALFFLGRGARSMIVAAARFLERGHARFLGLAQQLGLHFLAGGDVFGRRRAARRRGGRSRLRRRLGRFGGRLGRLGRRRFARLAEDAALLDLDHDRVRAAMAEALLDLAGLDRALEAQRRPGAKLRFFGLIGHSVPSSKFFGVNFVSRAGAQGGFATL